MSILKNNNLFISFYADDTRFFHSISKIINGKSYFYSIYLSGIFYLLLKFRIPLNFNNKFLKNKTISTESINDIIKYEKIQNIFNEINLHNAAKKYIYIFNYLIQSKNINKLYLSGDTRLIIKAAEYAGKLNNCKIMYFEQGPFETSILDENGVNKDCSFRDVDFTPNNANINNVKNPKIKWINYLRVFDIVLYNLFNYKSDHLRNEVGYNLFKENSIKTRTRSMKYILLILQVPNDANMILNSPNFTRHIDILKWTYENIPKEYDLVVREHPKFIGRYETELYDYILSKNIVVDNMELCKSINDASLIVVNNSTVGIEAVFMNKKVVVLGDSYYDKIKCVFKYKKESTPKDFFEKAINSKLNNESGYSFINYLLENELIGFHFRDKNYNLNDKILIKKLTK
ncbi:MAG: hypothetical protein CMG00_05890 [Candidatus Marinimicrobia bacterium]|nr:hypothetical protein [Candidatus Neomarinimicrobiota bacterium]